MAPTTPWYCLKGKNIFKQSVILLGPKMRISLCIDQLRRNRTRSPDLRTPPSST